MNPETTHIIKLDAAEPPHDWGRFVALLCMMMFYTRFIEGLHYIWTEGFERYVNNMPNGLGREAGSAGLAIIMCLCARQVWQGSRNKIFYLILAAIAIMGLQAYEAIDYGKYSYCGIFTFWQSMHLHPWVGIAVAMIFNDLPWLSVFIIAAYLAYFGRPRFLRRYQPWAILAMSWCGAILLERLAPCLASLTYQLPRLRLEYIRNDLLQLAPSLLLIGLLRNSKWAAWPAVLIAAVDSAPSPITAWIGCWLSRDAMQALFASLPPKLLGIPPNPFEFGSCYLNSDFFLAVFVTPIMSAGPWLLIAYYARYYPMRIQPDDGSPYPRRYCGNCEYNLHGIEAKVCPECGRQLVA